MECIRKIIIDVLTLRNIKKVITVDDTDIKSIQIQPVDKKKQININVDIHEGFVLEVYNNYSFLITNKIPNTKSQDEIKEENKFLIMFNNIFLPNKNGRFDEKTITKIACAELKNILLNKTITIYNPKYFLQKAGSSKKIKVIFGDVYLDNLYVNHWLVDNKYAVSNYIVPSNWLTYKLKGIY